MAASRARSRSRTATELMIHCDSKTYVPLFGKPCVGASTELESSSAVDPGNPTVKYHPIDTRMSGSDFKPNVTGLAFHFGTTTDCNAGPRNALLDQPGYDWFTGAYTYISADDCWSRGFCRAEVAAAAYGS